MPWDEARHRSRDRRRAAVAAVVVLVALIAGGAVVVGIARAQAGSGDAPGGRATGDAGGPGGGTTSPSVQPVVPARRVGAVRPEAPNRSVLPDGQVVPIEPAGTAGDGSLAVPEDIRVAGWWRGGSRLGDPFGSTLLAAHVDSFTQGLGPYASLLSVTQGQRITPFSPHLRETFSVVSLALVPRGTLSDHPRIFSSRGARRLTLVTCAGPYDVDRGGYQNLAVITARPVAEVTRRSTR
jgi:hypothetical protein